MSSEARQLLFRQTGRPAEVLEVASMVPGDPGPGEVLVRVSASPINPADLNTIEGTYGVKLELPGVPGIEGCGVVERSAADGFVPGDRVMFLERAATWATRTTVPASRLFKLPPEIDPLQAAMLKVNPATAWQLLHGYASLDAGDWVVQNLGNSAVGRCVIQIARDMGVKTISFVRKPEQVAALKALGADEVLVDDDAGQAAALEVMGGANAALAFNAMIDGVSPYILWLRCAWGWVLADDRGAGRRGYRGVRADPAAALMLKSSGCQLSHVTMSDCFEDDR